MKKYLGLLTLILASCSQTQEARRPISQTSGTFIKESIDRNKKLIQFEEKQIDSIIKNNPETEYVSSADGFWYAYTTKNTTDTIHPKRGDIAYFDYEIKDLKGAIIYSKEELKPKTYYVDKEDIIIGLRNGIKLMKKNETVTFLFPSHKAYGYHGDDKKIQPNQPLQITVTLHTFKPEN